MWIDHKNLTPEERMDRIADILTRGVLRLIEKKKRKRNNPHSSTNNTPVKKADSSGNIPSEKP